MRKLRWIVLTGGLVTLAPVVPANAASPQASCPGQELSALAPVLGADLGAFISFEAQNPSSRDGRTSARRSASSRTRTVRTARRSSETFRRSTRL
jgi:hypothetical protein